MHENFNPQSFTLIRFEPSNLVLQHNGTKKLYRYEEVQGQIAEGPEHQLILKAERLGDGFLYEKELTSLAKEMQPRFEASVKTFFDELELNNTFEPILMYLQRGLNHNGLCLETILIDHSENIRLKDPRLARGCGNSGSAFQKLGNIMLQCALLKGEKEISSMEKSKVALAKALTRFSSKFIANLWILSNNDEVLRNQIDLTQKEPSNPQYSQLISQIEKLKTAATPSQQKKDIFKSVQQKRIVVIPPLNLKFNKTKKAEIKLELSGKNRQHNENENGESMPKTSKKTDFIQKIINLKCQTNKNLESKLKIKQQKPETMENPEVSIKKKGKTVDRKAKFQQRSN